MPCCRIESISSCNASRPKSFRGCSALGTIPARLIWYTLSPDSATSVLVAMEGVPISAPRPLPRPERAMRLRLPEQPPQRKQQPAPSSRALPFYLAPNRLSLPLEIASLPPPRPPPQKKVKKSLKKVIDTHSPNLVSTRHGSKTDTGLLPGRFFVCSDPSNQKNNTNTTGKEKEHIPCIH